jgi:hypothetical protein
MTYTCGAESKQSRRKYRLEPARGIAVFVVLLNCEWPTGRLTDKESGLQGFNDCWVLVWKVVLPDPSLWVGLVNEVRAPGKSEQLYTHIIVGPFSRLSIVVVIEERRDTGLALVSNSEFICSDLADGGRLNWAAC